MISAEAQRTLVKSPPELWAELSDPESLARHLGELGEIRIVKTEPESAVEWEGEGISGTVALKASGWGTKVTLTATRQSSEQPAAPEPEPEPQLAVGPAPESVPEAESAPQAESVLEAEPVQEAESVLEAEPTQEAEPMQEAKPTLESEPEAERTPGFFARLFRRWRPKPVFVPEAEPKIVLDTVQPEPEADPEPELGPEAPAEPAAPAEPQPDIAAELLALEESSAAETTAVLTAVLDRLGAAHHRPFSRS